MSSPSRPHPCDAVLCRSGEITGPIRLPLKDSQLFIEAFNRVYRKAGLSIAGPVPTDSTSITSAASSVPEDRLFGSVPDIASSQKNPDASADRHR